MLTIQPLNGFILVREDETPSTVARFRNSNSDVDMQEPVTGRVLGLSNDQIFFEDHLEVRKYDRVLYSPTNVIQVEVSEHQHIYLVPFANLLAVFRADTKVPQEV